MQKHIRDIEKFAATGLQHLSVQEESAGQELCNKCLGHGCDRQDARKKN